MRFDENNGSKGLCAHKVITYFYSAPETFAIITCWNPRKFLFKIYICDLKRLIFFKRLPPTRYSILFNLSSIYYAQHVQTDIENTQL